MAEKKIFFTKCRLLPNGCALDEEYDITLGAPEIDYYESIESPTISMSLRFLDVDQVLGRKGITGGELIEVTVKDGDEDEFKITKDHKMMLNSVVDMNTQTSFQEATLEFVSQETIINETSRLNKKFTGNISQIVEDILTKDKKGILTKKKVFGPKTETTNYDLTIEEDRTTNSYSFVGNLKRPFDTIQWLCPKSQASNKSFGFLFFENLDGYHFRSIESLLDQKSLPPYTYTDNPFDSQNKAIILQNKVESTNDIGLNCRLGMYANKTIYIDIENQEASVDDFSIEELKLRKPPRLMEGLEKHPTRLMLRIDDVGVAQVGAAKSETVPKSELAKYQNKSYIRNNLLFSQCLRISIPLNTTLRVGLILEIKLPVKKGDGKTETGTYGTDKTNDPSGRYLIAELRHLIGREKAETQLKLIRDVFTPDKSQITDSGELVEADNRHYGNTFPPGSF
jgi:hypothetical protein|tara:strand:- start:251 stop:1609 length:1359 start_codon:yes stop_codon:yes gene_type:complete